MNILLIPLMLVAVLGLLLCALANLLTWSNQFGAVMSLFNEELQTGISMALVGGLFAVWIPAVLIAQRINNGNRLNFSWKKVLAGCPDWMRYAAFTIFGYAIVNFLLIVTSPDIGNEQGIRAFSGHGMAFYAMAFSIFYSSWRLPRILRTHYCPAGHEVAYENKFCPTCGLPTAQSGQDGL